MDETDHTMMGGPSAPVDYGGYLPLAGVRVFWTSLGVLLSMFTFLAWKFEVGAGWWWWWW